MRPLLSILTLATLFGCATSGLTSQIGDTTGIREGNYDFFASIPGQHLRGTLRILKDTVLVDAEGSGCVPSVQPIQTNRNVFFYGCTSGALLTFDRNNPVQRSKWSTSVPVRRQREVCVQTEIRSGREVCVRREIETYEVMESRSGTVQVVRRSSS
ncbi:MAG TPA: hypothetical protein VF128_12790 [Gemmatimonadaceae bacterium]